MIGRIRIRAVGAAKSCLLQRIRALSFSSSSPLSSTATTSSIDYVKLKTSFQDIDFERKDLVESFDKVLEYYDVSLPKPLRTKIESLVPESVRDDFYFSLLRSTTGVPPHKDSEILATINIYVKGGGYSSHFYDVKDNVTGSSLQADLHNNQEDEDEDEAATHYDYDDVIEKSFFKAKDGSAYLLDVTQVHSVEPFNIENDHSDEKNERLAITFATAEHSFEDVHQMLKETGNA